MRELVSLSLAGAEMATAVEPQAVHVVISIEHRKSYERVFTMAFYVLCYMSG